MPLMGTLIDNFDGPSLDTAKWNAVNPAGITGFQTANTYTFAADEDFTGDAYLVSDIPYQLTGSHVQIGLVKSAPIVLDYEVIPVAVTLNPANFDSSYLIRIRANTVYCMRYVALFPTLVASVPYNAATMRFFRIRESGGTVYYETAATPKGFWFVEGSTAATVSTAAMYFRFGIHGDFADLLSRQTTFDNVNYIYPPPVPFPNGAIPVSFELAFGADLRANQSTWTWTDLTDIQEAKLMQQTVDIKRGRANEANNVTATEAEFTLDNPEGDLTPSNPSSIYWPDVKVGTPGRWAVHAGTPRLKTINNTNSYAYVDPEDKFRIVLNPDIRVDLQLDPVIYDSTEVQVVGMYNTVGNLRGWRLSIVAGGYLKLEWSTDGTLAGNTSVTSVYPGVPMSARTVIRATLVRDNGAGGHTVIFYVGESISGPWRQIGPTITRAGVTNVFGAPTRLSVGTLGDDQPLSQTLGASVYQFQLWDMQFGIITADADFKNQLPGAPVFTDPAGWLWSVAGTAQITDKWYRIIGTADAWKPKWPWGDLSEQQDGGLGDGEARTDIELAGILRRLGTGESPLGSPIRRDAQADPSIRAYWPMEDEKGAAHFSSALPGGSPLYYSGAVNFEARDTLAGSKPLPSFTATTALSGNVSGQFSGQYIIDWYVFVPSTIPAATMLLTAQTTGTVVFWRISVSNAIFSVNGYNYDNQLVTVNTGASPLFLDRWTHLRLFARQNGSNVTWDFYAYQVQVYPDPLVGIGFGGNYAGSIGGVAAVRLDPEAGLVNIGMGHLGIYDALNAEADRASQGWIFEASAARIARLCAEESISFKIIGNPATTTRMGIQQVATLLELLQDAQAADGGILYEQPEGLGLVYRTRESMYNQPPNMILDGLPKQISNPLEPVLDDYLIRNYIDASRTGGPASIVVNDAESIAEHGLYDESVTLNVFQDADLLDSAAWLLNLGLSDDLRYSRASVNLGVAPESIDEWLSVDPGGRIDLVNTPPQLPDEEIRLMVQGYSEAISAFTWDVSANTTPAKPWDVFVIYDNTNEWLRDEEEWRLEPDPSVLTTEIDEDDTTLSVASDPAWITSAADAAGFPFDINVNGERMRVTAIFAAAGSSAFLGAGNAATVATVSFVAPSIVAAAVGDRLICAYCSFTNTGAYTVPGGMTLGAASNGTKSSAMNANLVLAAAGATGTKTATFAVANAYSAVSVVVHRGVGTPAIIEFLSTVTGVGVAATLTMTINGQVGDWLLAIHAWDWDPGNNMVAPSGGPAGTWFKVADSTLADLGTSRVQVWVKQLTQAGKFTITYPTVGGINDNHARLYVLRDVSGFSQQFTVVRSVNNVVSDHPIGTEVELWFQPGLAK